MPAGISAPTRNAVLQSMQPDRNDRPQTISDFLSILDGDEESTILSPDDDEQEATIIEETVIAPTPEPTPTPSPAPKPQPQVQPKTPQPQQIKQEEPQEYEYEEEETNYTLQKLCIFGAWLLIISLIIYFC